MRLLNVHTFKLHEFIGKGIPPYAILSHRWEEDEVTFQALQAGDGPGMKGWHKIQGCCKQAVEDEFEYVWIDSCCIDKSSSSELMEAINSMFHWYQDAESCYAFLADVCLAPATSTADDSIMDDSVMKYSDSAWISSFYASKWFTRGWTLQELLAPDNVIFFDKNWREIGTKESLNDHVTAITGIKDIFNFEKASIAQRFSWASRRQTTRVEDTAYCLMGLFGVNMALLYGEGGTAFLRLQLEILKISNDESIFAWQSHGRFDRGVGLLAPDPSCFKHSNDIKCVHPKPLPRRPYTMTNNGLQFEATLIRADTQAFRADQANDSNQLHLCPLNCIRQGKESHLLSVILSHLEGCSEDHFTRTFAHNLTPLDVQELVTGNGRDASKPQPRTIFIEQPHLSLRSIRQSRPQCIFQFDTRRLSGSGFLLRRKYFESPKHGIWKDNTTDYGLLKLRSHSTVLLKYSSYSVPGLSIIVRISCGASSASLGLQVKPDSGPSPDIESLLGKVPIPRENWIKACDFVDRTVDFKLASTKISQSLRPFAFWNVVAVFQKRLAGRQIFDFELSIEKAGP